MSWCGYRWFVVRLWVRSRPKKLAWWLAWRLPRQVALFALVRVMSARGRDSRAFLEAYDDAYKDWEAGYGK